MTRRLLSAAVLALTLLAAGIAFAQEKKAQDSEKKVRMRDLPAAVQAAVKEQSKGAQLRGLAKEVEDGQTFYEAELRVGRHTKDVLFDTEGRVVSVEEEVTLASLPPLVKAEIQKQAGKGRIALVETVTKGGTLVYYEAHIRGGGKAREVKVSPEGAVVK
ncbi:MAG TPA: hypothetical protein VFD58_09145 [Blastocatellia bacterium]|nr:hypothetical protein [Blastocatellia bacterium]